MSLESALRELGKEIQKDARFEAIQAAAAKNDANEELQKQMQEMQLLSLKYQQEAGKADEADSERIAKLQEDYQNLYEQIMQMESKTKNMF